MTTPQSNDSGASPMQLADDPCQDKLSLSGIYDDELHDEAHAPARIDLFKATEIARAHGHRSAPYAGYAHDLGNGTLLSCSPQGVFSIITRP